MTVKIKCPEYLKTNYEKFIWKRYGIDINIKEERIFIGLNSYEAFCNIYFPHYFYLEPSYFHKRLVKIFEDKLFEMIAIIGFRGSAKSTHASMAFPTWEIVKGEHHFIILINDTGTQRDINIENIKNEFQENELLKSDFASIRPKNEKYLKWNKSELEFGNNVFLLGRSRGQKVRGLRFRQWRPSLVVGDDLEDLEWVQRKENRDKTERWLKSEVIPAIEEAKAKLIIIGNLLHTDALMSRLKRHKIMKTLQFPLFNKRTGEVTWKAKYPTPESIEKQKARVDKPSIWLREYLLKIVPEEGAIVQDTDIHYYDYKAMESELYAKARNGGAGNDLAISDKNSADFTAFVSGIVIREEGRDVLYILPHIVHKHIDLFQTIQEAKNVMSILPMGSRLFVEDVGYQQAAIKEMKRKGINAFGIRPITDKRARLETASVHIKTGAVKFPKEMNEELEALFTEMLGFGIEDHDDLCDALVYLILGMFGKKQGSFGVGKGDQL